MIVFNPRTTLTKPEVYESKRIRLTSQILHIGSEVQRLNPFEYVQTSNRVYLPHSDSLAKALKQRGYLDDYITAIENRQSIVRLLENAFGENWQNAKDPNNEPIFPELFSSRKWPDGQVTDLRPMIRNGMGQFYIPGSSIKGAIRTAIAYHLLKHADKYQVPQQHRVSAIEEKLRETLGGGGLSKFQQKRLDDDLFERNLFSNFDLSYQGQPIRAKLGPNTDFMRAIQVTDSQPLVEDKLITKQGKEIPYNIPVVAEVMVSSHYQNGQAKYRASIYAEMVVKVRTEFTLSVNPEMLSWFSHQEGMQLPFKTVDDILNICQEFAQQQWDFEHDYWEDIQNKQNEKGRNLDFSEIRDIYEYEKCPHSLRLGWGSGMRGTTVNLLFPDDLVADIRDACGIRAPGFNAPKSRRTVISHKGEIKYVPGWVKFQELKN
ncbi:type III-A CRISPR-associated RAMP protein Csm5 [Laspinema olomoucense]|uniref:type III-A CRISPR-associated RAMP protein Csm5 n=1 Tax=Laspinema olomoucense TaxID=3231600 RepID=UPI0021BA6C54|nr:type III-A CRISPR-associated RAMP protein Csm5 [Laspinema sp. D3c]MCT7995983.1 type III-A CRISPR-associated RAMP protein Csm5 [Laspinema sp. D3c]